MIARISGCVENLVLVFVVVYVFIKPLGFPAAYDRGASRLSISNGWCMSEAARRSGLTPVLLRIILQHQHQHHHHHRGRHGGRSRASPPIFASPFVLDAAPTPNPTESGQVEYRPRAPYLQRLEKFESLQKIIRSCRNRGHRPS